MATSGQNLSSYNKDQLPDGSSYKIGIVVSEWNDEITGNLLKGCKSALIDANVPEENIKVHYVPGTFELPLGAQFLIEGGDFDGIVTIGSVIQGETKHFDFVCEAASLGIKDVGLKYNLPVIFCVLTDNTKQQAIDRSGGIHGNKGIEGAVACLKMIALKEKLGS